MKPLRTLALLALTATAVLGTGGMAAAEDSGWGAPPPNVADDSGWGTPPVDDPAPAPSTTPGTSTTFDSGWG